ncbi:MAG: ABC transporter substrate-binding protein [Burkholderiaceae bacterium]|nr:ABC transporter substrate-binding protein [Burkholderiaceae bacterium]
MPSRRRWLGTTAALALALLGPASATARASLLHVFGKPPANPRNVFAAGPPAAVLLAALAPDRLPGWPMAVGNEARALLPAVARDKPVLGRLSGRGSTVSLEALLALRPDLVLDAGTVDATYLSAAQRVTEQTGLPYVLVDGRLADTPAQLREVGQLLGVSARAQLLAAHAEETLAQAAFLRAQGTDRPSVFLARGADGLETALAGSINGEIIEAAGGRNVAATGRGGVARVSMEQVLGWAPDWVLTQDRNFFRHARGDALWGALQAVREGRLLLAPDRPFGWIDGPPGINRLAGVRWLAMALRSGRSPGAEAIDEALRFQILFYGVAPAREVLQSLLDGRG